MLKTSALLASLATAVVLMAPAPGGAQTAPADVAFGGGSFTAKTLGTSLSLLRRGDGRVTGRVGTGVACKIFFPNVIVKLSGALTGENFTATGTKRLTKKGRVKITVTGTFAGDQVTGTLTSKATNVKGCENFSRSFVARAEKSPAGAPAAPPADGTRLEGLTDQTAGGLRLPVMLQVRSNATRIIALWQATMECGPKPVIVPAVNFTPATKIAADGTFTKSETYTIRYAGGFSDRFRVSFKGRFLADGATGTLRARMQTRKKGSRFYPCDSGTINWTATATTG